MEEHNEKWPSKRVVKGGIFNLPKVKYSKETHDFLNRKLQIITHNLKNVINMADLIYSQNIDSIKCLRRNSADGRAKTKYFAAR